MESHTHRAQVNTRYGRKNDGSRGCPRLEPRSVCDNVIKLRYALDRKIVWGWLNGHRVTAEPLTREAESLGSRRDEWRMEAES